MSHPVPRTDWGGIQDSLTRQAMDAAIPAGRERHVPVPTGITAPVDGSDRPDGIIAQYRAKQVSRKAATEYLEVWYRAQLEVARHRLSEIARVRKAEATLFAEQFLHGINSQHLEYLTSLGLRNEVVRSRAFIQLSEQTAAALREIQGRDWPQQMVDRTIQAVLERYEAFFRKLTAELGA
jgi:hypothetical protein